MKKTITIFLIWTIILSISNGLAINSRFSYDLSVENIDNLIPCENNDEQILQKLNTLDGFFTENRGQVGNDSVRYYIQGKGIWFLDDGIVFEVREDLSFNSPQSTVHSP